MEFLNTIYMAIYMTALTKMTILNINFALFCLMKRDGVNRMFPFTKRDSTILEIFHVFSRCHHNDISVIMMTSSSKSCAIS